MTLQDFLDRHPACDTVELVLVDPSGVVRGKWAPASTLKKAFGEGVNFPLSLHGLDIWGNEVPETGLHIESGDLDGACTGVPHTLCAVPWNGTSDVDGEIDPAELSNAQIILQTRQIGGAPFSGCARTVLEDAVDALADTGLVATCAFELEFHLLESVEDSGFTPVGPQATPDAQSMYGLDALAEHSSFFARLRTACALANLPIDTIVKEAGIGQYEVNLHHRADAMRAADDVVLLKRCVIECARADGLTATFMAKPFLDQPGNGMHVHASFADREGRNIFAGTDGEARQRHAVNGLLETLPDMTLAFINTMNGFRRMAPNSYAPTRANWGDNNRSVAIRLPAAPEAARRIEHRVAGADANPYLVLAAILRGVAKGLADGREPPAAVEGNAYDPATANRGKRLPSSMAEAIEMFEESAFAKDALGPQMAHNLVAIKRAELARFADDISPLERRTYV